MFVSVSSVFLTLVFLVSFPLSIGAQSSPASAPGQANASAPRSDLDAFMNTSRAVNIEDLRRGARNDKSRNGCCRQQGAKRDSG